MQLDKQTWQVNTDQRAIKICYQVYALDLSVRTAYLDSRRGFFNGSSLFLEVAEQSHLKHEVTLHPPIAPMQQDWLLATSMTRESGEQWQFGRFSAQNYDELIDHPVEMGHFSHAHFFVDDIRHDVVLAGRHHADLNRLCLDLEKICRTLELFGAPAPFNNYLFMTAVLENGYGGLEHPQFNGINVQSQGFTHGSSPAMNADYRNYLSLCSHEYFIFGM